MRSQFPWRSVRITIRGIICVALVTFPPVANNNVSLWNTSTKEKTHQASHGTEMSCRCKERSLTRLSGRRGVLYPQPPFSIHRNRPYLVGAFQSKKEGIFKRRYLEAKAMSAAPLEALLRSLAWYSTLPLRRKLNPQCKRFGHGSEKTFFPCKGSL